MRKIVLTGLVYSILTTTGYCAGFSSLKFGGDARAVALGMAYTALSNDGSGGYWNPAGLAWLRKKNLLFSICRWIESVRSEFFGLGWGGEQSGFGIHVLYTEVGEIEHRIVPSPKPLQVFSAREFTAGVSYARMIKAKFSVGVTVKMVYEKIFIEETTGIAGDFGFQWNIWEKGPRIGGVIQNVGKTGRLKNEDIALPVTGRVGIVLPFNMLQGRCLFVMDGVKEREFPFHVHGGIEYGWNERLYLRIGYQTGYMARDVMGGAGIVWRRYCLNYAYMPFRSGFGDTHRLSMGITW